MYIFLIMISIPLFSKLSFEIAPYKTLDLEDSTWFRIVLLDNETQNLVSNLYTNVTQEIKEKKVSLNIPKTKKYQCLKLEVLHNHEYEYCYKTKIKSENEFIVFYKDKHFERSIYTVSNNQIVAAKRKMLHDWPLLFLIISTSAFWILFFKCKKRYMKSRHRKNNN